MIKEIVTVSIRRINPRDKGCFININIIAAVNEIKDRLRMIQRIV